MLINVWSPNDDAYHPLSPPHRKLLHAIHPVAEEDVEVSWPKVSSVTDTSKCSASAFVTDQTAISAGFAEGAGGGGYVCSLLLLCWVPPMVGAAGWQ